MQEHGEKGLPRFVMEAGVALLTGAFGIAVCYGSIEAGAGWTDMGPDAGYFPFYIGLLIVFAMVVYFSVAFLIGGANLGMIRRNLKRKAKAAPGEESTE